MNVLALSRSIALAGAATAALAACGSWVDQGVARMKGLLPHHAPPAAVQQARPPAFDRDMVAAVSGGTGNDMPVKVRFALRDRPEIGKSATLDLEVVPSAQLDRLVAVFHAQDGLSVSAGAQPAQSDHPEPGIPIAHELTIVPQRDGIFYLDATVLVDFGNESVARTFTIPVIAGSGAP